METQIQTIETVAKDVFTLFGVNRKTAKVEFNYLNNKVRLIHNKTVVSKTSIILNRSVLEKLSVQLSHIEDLETRMLETIKRGLIKTLTKLGVKIVEPVSEVVEMPQQNKEIVFVAEFIDTSELVKFNHENIDEVLNANRPFRINIVENMILKEVA